MSRSQESKRLTGSTRVSCRRLQRRLQKTYGNTNERFREKQMNRTHAAAQDNCSECVAQSLSCKKFTGTGSTRAGRTRSRCRWTAIHPFVDLIVHLYLGVALHSICRKKSRFELPTKPGVYMSKLGGPGTLCPDMKEHDDEINVFL